MTKDELKAQYPDLIAEVEADARASVNTDEAVRTAVQAEQARIAAIDEVAALFPENLVQDAKYGENACTAEQLAYRAAVNARKQGKAFLAALESDTKNSGAEGVGAAPAPQGITDGELTDSQKQAKADAVFAELLGKKKEV